MDDAIREKIRSFDKLQVGWDSYGASPVPTAVVHKTLAFLESIEVIPTARESIQIEFKSGETEIEIEISLKSIQFLIDDNEGRMMSEVGVYQ